MTEEKINTIVFDFGGVLLDWDRRYLYRKVFKDEAEMNFFLSEICSMEWNLSLDKGKPFKQGVAELREKYPHYAKEIEMYDSRWEEMIGEVFTGSVDILKALCESYPVYGLTNFSEEKLKLTMKKYDFFKLFKGIVVSGVEKEIKPQPKIYEILLERYHLNPETTVFIDDSLPNIEMARKLKIKGIHFKNPSQLRADLKSLGIRI